MEFLLPIDIQKLKPGLSYEDGIVMLGSCFTAHIGNYLGNLKFKVLQNPNGIVFDPASIASSLVSYVENRKYARADLFELNEYWQSWQHHTSFSGMNQIYMLDHINLSQQKAHEFLKTAKWLIITLGTSFSYRLHSDFSLRYAGSGLRGEVANCHRAPAQWFKKVLMGQDESYLLLKAAISLITEYNPAIKVIFTVSPVRHIRDGITENNRSKARLIEVVHRLVEECTAIHYFPAYELVIDVLRDYRFYDIDMIHPNYQGTKYVLQQFTNHFIEASAQPVMEELNKLLLAKNHKAFDRKTNAHKQFLLTSLNKTRELQLKCPFLDLSDELNYFAG